jgi:hypothetical protein
VYLIEPERYVVDSLPMRTWWRAALLAHGPNTCLVASSGAGAFGLHGLPFRPATVEVAIVGGPPRQRRQPSLPLSRADMMVPQILVRQLPVTAHEVVIVNGLPVRRGDLTVIDAGLDLDRAGMLSLLDSALHLGVVTEVDLQVALDAARGRPGIQLLREMAAMADGRAESIVESRVRLACIDGGVPPDDLQYVVRTDDGHVIGIGDLGWHEKRRRPLLAEADGESVHGQPKAIFRDRMRGNALASAACDTVRFVYADTFKPNYIASVIRSALAAG